MSLNLLNRIIKPLFVRAYVSAFDINTQNIETAIKLTGPHKKLLDVGCWDGKWTLYWAKVAQARNVYGIEPVKTAASQAKSLGITMFPIAADKIKWPLPNNSLDCIVSNQVVEHLTDLDKYFSEAVRVLKPGGTIITSTNNLSSLHNLFSLTMGWAPFDLSNCSYNSSNLGNPLSLHLGADKCLQPSWTHKCVYTAHWLNSWQISYGLTPKLTLGAGLYPFPSNWGKVIKKYSAFITLVAQKPRIKKS